MKELRANGYYTQTGWQGKTPDGSMGVPSHNGVTLEWDATMDDLGLEKRCYAIDMGRMGLRLLYLNGNRMKKHNPARPENKYVMYRAMTYAGGLFADQRNCHGVYSIA